MPLARLVGAALFIPVGSVASYYAALGLNGDLSTIDSNGSALGICLMVALVLAVARLADDETWIERGLTAVALGFAYYLLTWRIWGGIVPSPDAQPHLVWLGLCLAAFSPAAVIMAASARLSSWRDSRRNSASPSR